MSQMSRQLGTTNLLRGLGRPTDPPCLLHTPLIARALFSESPLAYLDKIRVASETYLTRSTTRYHHGHGRDPDCLGLFLQTTPRLAE